MALAGSVGKPHSLVVGLQTALDRPWLTLKLAGQLGWIRMAPVLLKLFRSAISTEIVDIQPDLVRQREVCEVYQGKRGSTQRLSRKEEVMLAQMRSGQSKLFGRI